MLSRGYGTINFFLASFELFRDLFHFLQTLIGVHFAGLFQQL